MIDRTKIPETKELEKISFVNPHIFDITSSVFLYWMNEVSDETVRLELHFDAGTNRGEEKISSIVNALLFSGTTTKKSTQIHNELDSLGAFIDQEIGQETAVVSLYCLRENFDAAFEIFANAIDEVIFDENEVSDIIRERKQQFLIASEKVNVLARRAYQKQVFSNAPSYARYMELHDYDAITVKGLQKFHANYYKHGLTEAVVVSNLEQNQIDRIIDRIGAWAKVGSIDSLQQIENIPGRLHIEKKDALQTAIRMGIPLFNKNHVDFIDFTVLQTIFGDYFGSRLMSNIREDKGYTYGIGCAVSELKGTGHFLIATEVGKEVCDATLKEIKFEIERLQNELVSNEELDLVKNYMLGQLLKSADGPNAMMDLYLSVRFQKLDYSFYNKAIEAVKNIDAQRIQDLAKRYLKWDEFTIVTAG